jgi:hypothetical protein
MMPDEFEERYLDVLHNIETALVSVYRENKAMTDYDAQRAIESLIKFYQADASGRTANLPLLKPLAQDAFERVQMICEVRLGRETMADHKGREVHLPIEPKSVPEILACLKRVRRSIQKWNKEGGRRGYFDFVNQFLP